MANSAPSSAPFPLAVLIASWRLRSHAGGTARPGKPNRRLLQDRNDLLFGYLLLRFVGLFNGRQTKKQAGTFQGVGSSRTPAVRHHAFQAAKDLRRLSTITFLHLIAASIHQRPDRR